MAIIFSVIFEISSSGYITARDGAFSTLSDKAKLQKINLLISCVISLLLLLSSQSFLLAYQYNCSAYYIGKKYYYYYINNYLYIILIYIL
jgi:hypothetical protein